MMCRAVALMIILACVASVSAAERNETFANRRGVNISH